MDEVALKYIESLIQQTEAMTIENLNKAKLERKIKLDKNHFKLDNDTKR